MKFIFYSPVALEKWDWNNINNGIGGSETSHIEMAWRLARRGHEVISYSPVSWKGTKTWRNVTWKPLENVDWNEDGIWLLYRCPEAIEKFKVKSKNRKLWFISQDEFYPTWKPEYAKKLDKFFALCYRHMQNIIKHHPELSDVIDITSNGIQIDVIREIEKTEIKRNPKRIMYASSPDRGLLYVLKTFKRAKEIVSDLELHVFYGFNNINKLIKMSPVFKSYAENKDAINELLKQPDVYWHGRIGQRDLMNEWRKTGIWLYQTNFTETSCITCMEAQALGAIPITNPLWALEENIMDGIFIDGDAYNDPLTKSKYVAEIIRLASNPGLQDTIRPMMMKKARYKFNWERVVDQWEMKLLGYDKDRIYYSQYAFQLKHAKGDILNVGCDIDAGNLKALGAKNIDIKHEIRAMGIMTKEDELADIRSMPSKFFGKFNTVILGDILEHMSPQDIEKALEESKKCLKKDSSIIITIPHDTRPRNEQHDNFCDDYSKDIPSYHEREVTRDEMFSHFKRVGLKPKVIQDIDYTHTMGTGFVCR